MVQMCPAKSIIVPFKKQMYSSGSIILSYKDDKCICVSIHAPTRGATDIDADQLYQAMFQSTHPRGVRQSKRTSQHIIIEVSIHAPTRGATSISMRLPPRRHCFNPRTHEGCDNATYEARLKHQVSIHAPTRGATGSTKRGR